MANDLETQLRELIRLAEEELADPATHHPEHEPYYRGFVHGLERALKALNETRQVRG